MKMHKAVGRIAFLASAIGAAAWAFWGAKGQIAASERAAQIVQTPQPPSKAPAEFGVPPGPMVLRVATAKGRPLSGVKIFQWRAGEPSDKAFLGVTDGAGRVELDSADPHYLRLIALRPNGQIEMHYEGDRLKFGPSRAVRLRVTDGRGRPWARHRITLFPTDYAGEKLQPFGFVKPAPFLAPALASRLTRTTDSGGNVTFPGLPVDQPFTVIAHVEGRPLEMEGCVLPGRQLDMVVRQDGEVTGRVTRRETGAPLAGVKVALVQTNDGVFPTPVVRDAITDAKGWYRFEGLLNCGYSIRLKDPAKAAGGPCWIEAKPDDHLWFYRGYDGTPPANWSYDGLSMSHTRLWSRRRVTRCDFRWTPSAFLTVKTDPWDFPWGAVKLINGEGKIFGEELGKDGEKTIPAPAGDYTLRLSARVRKGEYRDATLGKVTLRPGEAKRVQFGKQNPQE